MVKGDKCWIVENGFSVVSVEVLSISGNLVLIRTDKGKTLRLPKHRLFDTEEKARGTVKESEPVPEQKKKTPYDYMM